MEHSRSDYYKFASAYAQLSKEYELEGNLHQAFINKKMEVISLLKCGIMSGLQCYRGEEESQLNCESPELLAKAYMQSCAVMCRCYNKPLLDEFCKINGWDYDARDYDLLNQLTLDLRCVQVVPTEEIKDYGNTREYLKITEEALLDYIGDKTSPYIESVLRYNKYGNIFSILDSIGKDKKNQGKNRLDVLLGGK